jgi:uncharacterized protein (DUF1778 family)
MLFGGRYAVSCFEPEGFVRLSADLSVHTLCIHYYPEIEVARTAANTAVINLRAPSAKRALIDQAAQASGKNRSEFILDASCEKAQEVLADRTQFALDPRAFRRFAELLDAPLPAPDALVGLLRKRAPWES